MKEVFPKITPNVVRAGLRKTALKPLTSNTCTKCSLRCSTSGSFSPKYGKLEGSKNRLVIISDHPDHIRSAGERLLKEALEGNGFDYVYRTSIVKCPHNKTPTKKMIENCEKFILEELEAIKPHTIISLGKGPATLFNTTGSIDKLRAAVYDVEGLKDCTPKLIITQPIDKVLDDPSYKTEFISDFRKATTLLTGSGQVAINYSLMEDICEFEEWVNKVIEYGKGLEGTGKRLIVAADIETTGLDYFAEDAKIRTIAFSWQAGYGKGLIYEENRLEYQEVLKRFLESPYVHFVFHNATFDVAYIRVVEDIWVRNMVGDTMLMAYLLDPTRGVYGYGLIWGLLAAMLVE